MDFTWKEYQNAKNIIKVFEKQRQEIQSKRINFNWSRTYDDIVWERCEKFNKLQYEIRNLPIERREELGEDFINKLINEEKSKLLQVRMSRWRKSM